MLTQQTGSDPIELVAAYTYDGTGNRLRQTVYSSGSPAEIITYTNDIMGLTQVLVADDGSKQVYNLYGLDLIGQQASDDPQQRLLLADGLGSVRQEMMGDTVEAITSYDPYGNLLTQTGNSGTTYGYTGEQTDNNGLLYLHARYYNPAQRTFQSRDPWSGNSLQPQSMNGWNYVNSNPINFTDPTGKIPFSAEYCKTLYAFYQYRDCVLKEYGLNWDIQIEVADFDYQGQPECWYGPVPYRTSGYTEGGSSSVYTILGGWTGGNEIVYDFATMERQSFRFDGVISQFFFGVGILTQSIGEINGFRSWKTYKGINAIESDYSDWFGSHFIGGSGTILGVPGTDIGAGFGVGKIWFEGMPDDSINGTAWYIGVGIGAGFPIPVEGGVAATYYRPRQDNRQYWSLDNRGRKYVTEPILDHILQGQQTIGINMGEQQRNILTQNFPDMFTNITRKVPYQIFIYDQINRYSYGSGDTVSERPPQ